MGDMLNFQNKNSNIFEWWGTAAPNVAASALNDEWQPWCRWWAPGARFLDIWLIGAGGGGGSGFTKSVNAAGAGGGGGGSGGLTKVRFTLDQLPDVIYFLLPQGAPGGQTSAAAGANGGVAYVAIKPTTGTTLDVVLATSTSGGGVGGTNTTGGAAGAGASVIAQTSMGWSYLGSWTSHAGQIGGTGGGTTAAGLPATTFGVITGGAGGAGSTGGTAAGGDVTMATTTFFPSVLGGAAGPNDGASGIWWRDNPKYPFMATGGAGGGSTNTVGQVGGKGGDGAIGCGGGGGGAGPTFGKGGNGGDAYLLLIAS